MKTSLEYLLHMRIQKSDLILDTEKESIEESVNKLENFIIKSLV